MNVLVCNAGSSTVKYRLLDAGSGDPWCGGVVERIGGQSACATHWWLTADGRREQVRTEHGALDHRDAFERIVAHLDDLREDDRVPPPEALAHRVVHGGERYRQPVRIDDAVIAGIEALQSLAPLHNPPSLALIRASRKHKHFATLPQVALFDTAFHHTLPEAAFRYAVPEAWYRELGVRRYGFHGLSHEYVSGRAAELLEKSPASLRLISLHLGNGASVAAIDGGRCVETSMGMTPLEGLVMGTRSGDIDPAAVLYVACQLGLDAEQVEHQLTHESGLRGLCGEADMREVLALDGRGDEAAGRALAVYVHRLCKYIGACHAVLGGLDALIFTAGVGEHAPRVRTLVGERLAHLGIRLDAAANEATVGRDGAIHDPSAAVATLVICTDEERAMAQQAQRLLQP